MYNNFKLTELQEKALKYMVEGKNIFLTGPSGVGKSMIISMFKNLRGKSKNIAITSTTGVSSLLIGGTTLHSYLGIGLGTGSADYLTEKILKNNKIKQRWKTIDTLIIDEISMLSPELFDKLETVARNIRNGYSRNNFQIELVDGPPFGGIQLILVGDFLQLPVVGSDNFCFEAKTWNICVEHVVQLTEIIRQTDKEFQEVLNDIRYGIVSDRAKKLLLSRVNVEVKNDLGILPTKIQTTNEAVDRINSKEFEKLIQKNPEIYEYDMRIHFYDSVFNKEHAIEKYRKNCLAPDILQLCIGAQVMLLYNLNLDIGLANGSRGVVVNFIEDFPVVQFMNGQTHVIDFHDWEIEENEIKQVRITQVPLKLAYSISAHKSQGCTLDCAEIDLSNLFAHGQAYVALSRVKSEKGLNIVGINFDGIKAHPKALEFYKKI